MGSPFPNPNGYEKFLQAGGLLQGQPENYETMNEAELTSLIASNSEALAMVQTAFSNECRVPIKYSMAFISSHLNDLTVLKKLVQTMAAKGRLAESNGHPAEAAKIYLEVIHFGSESGRGGLMTDFLVGTAFENIGLKRLEKLFGNLDSSSCRETAKNLEIISSHHQSWDEVMRQEKIWNKNVFPGFKNYISFLFIENMDNEFRKSQREVKRKTLDHEDKMRRLLIRFAARAYELENGHLPAKIDDLTTNYLNSIPTDLFTKKTMRTLP